MRFEHQNQNRQLLVHASPLLSFPGQLGEAPDAVGDTLPAVAGATAAPDSEEEEDVGAMAARLEALRS